MKKFSAFIFAIMVLAAQSEDLLATSGAEAPQMKIFSEQYYGMIPANSALAAPDQMVAILNMNIKGDATITSVHVSNLADRALSGTVEYKGNGYIITDGYSWVELNCTNAGQNVKIDNDGTIFTVKMAPGQYKEGLEIRICDASHRVMHHVLPAFSLAPGEIRDVTIEYAPDNGVLFFEGFDTFVREGEHFQLDDSKVALANTLNMTIGKSVSEPYVKSRLMWDWYTAFRSNEMTGCISVGSNLRGILRTSRISNIKGIRTVTVEFDFSLGKHFDKEFQVIVRNGGYITAATVDGRKVKINKKKRSYKGNGSYITLANRKMLFSDMEQWHHATLTVERATDGMDLTFMTGDAAVGFHNFLIDNIKVTEGPEMERGDLRVLYWNIQNGMWYDQPNNYVNFVEWVKKYDPDVCVWCEASSIYYDNTYTKSPDRYLPAHWDELAARYGHCYTAIGEHCDNYPQEVTSKYPITTLKKIGKTDVPNPFNPATTCNVAHGCGVQQIEVNGKTINIVTMHTWPQAYAWGVKDKAARDESRSRNEGDLYRAFEMKYVVEHTINSPEFAGVENWLLLGDLNSRSRADQWHFKEDGNTTRLKCQDEIRDHTSMVDIIASKYPGDFMASTYGNSRIDIMYASPKMYARVKNAMILIDGWTAAFSVRRSPYEKTFIEPSDHRPILVDFVFGK